MHREKATFDDLGHRLPRRRHEIIPDAPRRAVPSWHRWAAAERWMEAQR
jgi:hypothetical protein